MSYAPRVGEGGGGLEGGGGAGNLFAALADKVDDRHVPGPQGLPRGPRRIRTGERASEEPPARLIRCSCHSSNLGGDKAIEAGLGREEVKR